MEGNVFTGKIKLFPFLFIVIFFVGCSPDRNDFSEFIDIKNEVSQQALIDELHNNEIPIKVDSEGVWFNSRDNELVHHIAVEVMSESQAYTSTSFRYVDSKYTAILISKLRDNDIAFETESINGETSIVLLQSNENEWKEYKQAVDQMFAEEQRKKLGL